MDALPLDTIIQGDCLAVLRSLPDACVDAVVTDPPSGIAFMGKSWDTDKGGRREWVAWLAEIMAEALRVLKPGGHALVWSLPRTSHWTALALEDAGFDIRDCLLHLFGSGFPKSHDVSKAIDRLAGAEREVLSTRIKKSGDMRSGNYAKGGYPDIALDITAPATDAAKQWSGWGTALKPAQEMWWLCRKPLAEGTVARQVLATGTGAINVDACRVGDEQTRTHIKDLTPFHGNRWGMPGVKTEMHGYKTNPPGRFPPNLLLSHSMFCDEASGECAADCPVRQLGEQSGVRTSGKMRADTMRSARSMYGQGNGYPTMRDTPGDTGTAARFYPTFRYQPKASRRERNAGLGDMLAKPPARYGRMTGTPEHGAKHDTPEANIHPTVKPLALMSWLITLITPPGGIVLEPFAGSGTTCVAAKQLGMHYIAVEQCEEYVMIARARTGEALPAAAQPAAPTLTTARKRSGGKRQNAVAATLWDAWDASEPAKESA